MTTQNELSLIVPKYPAVPGSRRTDTSRNASILAREKAEWLRPKCHAALKLKPMTADELADEIGEHFINVRPRCSELRRLGKVRDTGLRRANNFGNPQIVWEAT